MHSAPPLVRRLYVCEPRGHDSALRGRLLHRPGPLDDVRPGRARQESMGVRAIPPKPLSWLDASGGHRQPHRLSDHTD